MPPTAAPYCPSPPPHALSFPGTLPTTALDPQGAISRFTVVRPITLRNLVLYNLAPGGTYPPGTVPAPQLGTDDAAWGGSALPLWFFQGARWGRGGAPGWEGREGPRWRVCPKGDGGTLAAAIALRGASPVQQRAPIRTAIRPPHSPLLGW